MNTYYSPSNGSFTVELIQTYYLNKSTSTGFLPMLIYYPKYAVNCPVIIFSHDAYGTHDDYSSYGYYLASHGYISIHLAHSDSRVFNTTSDIRGFLIGIKNKPDIWLERVSDIKLVTDNFTKIIRDNPVLIAKMRTDKVGLIGHSLGAVTSAVSTGCRINIPNGLQGYSDSNAAIDTVALLSCPPEGTFGLYSDSFTEWDKSAIVFTGSIDDGRKAQSFYSSPIAYNKCLCSIDQAIRCDFGDIKGSKKGLFHTKVLEWSRTILLAWFDYQLKSKDDSLYWLKSETPGVMSNTLIEMSFK